jgi:hypothetical protein
MQVPHILNPLNNLNVANPSTTLRARPEFYRRNERKIGPVMVIPRRGSELKAVEEACREASRTVEPLNDLNVLNGPIRFEAFLSLLSFPRITSARVSAPCLRHFARGGNDVQAERRRNRESF